MISLHRCHGYSSDSDDIDLSGWKKKEEERKKELQKKIEEANERFALTKRLKVLLNGYLYDGYRWY